MSEEKKWAAFESPDAPGMGISTLIGVGNLEPMGPLDPHLIDVEETVQIHPIGLDPVDAIVGRSNATVIDAVGGTAQLLIADADVASGGEINASAHYNASDEICPEDDYILGINISGIAPVASFTATPTSGPGPLTVAFTDTSTNSPDTWLWEKNDGSGWVPFDGTPTVQNPTEDFDVGTWDVRLTASNSNGSDTDTQSDYIDSVTPGVPHQYWRLHDPVITGASDPPPPADLVLSEMRLFEYATDVTAGAAATSTPMISNPSAGTFPTWLYDNDLMTEVEWTLAPGGTWFVSMTFNFGVGNDKYVSGIMLGAGSDATKWMTGFCWSYSDDGVAWTLVGCVSGIAYPGDNTFTPLIDDFVIPPPVAAFSGTPLSGVTPLTVTFTDASTGTPTSWLWEKNDGSGWVPFDSTPTAQNPVEDFLGGTWDVRLTATNASGSDTETKIDYVEVEISPWVLRPAPVVHSNWAVDYSPIEDIWNIVCGNTTFLVSTDNGDTWTEETPTAAGGFQWRAGAYGLGIFVCGAAFGASSNALWSADAVTWSTPGNWGCGVTTRACFNADDGQFVCVGDDSIGYSSDGVTWTRQDAPTNGLIAIPFSGVCWSSDLGLYAAVASDDGGTGFSCQTSPDGINWTSRTMPGSNLPWQDVTYGNGLFVAVASSVGAASGTSAIATSPDGITWTLRTTPVLPAGGWMCVEYGAGMFIACSNSNTGLSTAMRSLDGITWTVEDSSIGNKNWRAIRYANGRFIAVSSNGGVDNIQTRQWP